MNNIITIRDALNSKLRYTKGVSGVGVGKKDGKYVLVVSIDSRKFEGYVPEEFMDLAVITEDLSDAEFHSSYKGLQWDD